MQKTTKEGIWTNTFFMVFFINFNVFLVFYSLLTILPIYVIDELNGTEGQAGLVTSIFLLSAIIVRPFSGMIIENIGKKRTLIISILFFGVSSLLYFWISDFYLLLGLRFFHGIWFSIASTLLITMTAEIIPVHRKGEGLGYFAMSMNLAVVVGPFLVLTLIQFITFKLLFLGLTSLIGIAFIFTLGIRLSEVRVVEVMKFKKMTLQDLFEARALPIAVVGFLTAFAYSGVLSFISVFAGSKGLFESVSLFFVVFAVSMLLLRPITGRLYDQKGANYVVFPSLLIFAIGLLVLSVTDSAIELLFAGILIGIGYGALLPSFQTIAIQLAPSNRTSHATATFYILFDLGMATGSFLLGLISSQLGFSKVYMICSGLIVFTIAIYKYISTLSNRKKRLRLGEKVLN